MKLGSGRLASQPYLGYGTKRFCLNKSRLINEVNLGRTRSCRKIRIHGAGAAQPAWLRLSL
jgi:hypothetical protein